MSILKNIFNDYKQTTQYYLHGLIFIICGTLALVVQKPLIVALPFLVLLFPIVFKFIISKTEQLFWLLLLFLPLSTELNITPSLGLDFPDEILMMLLTGLCFFKFIYKPSSFGINILKHPLLLIITFQLIWVLISTYYSQNPTLSIKFFLAKTWYIIPFVLLPQYIIRQQNDYRKIALLLLLPMVFVVIQCLLRHALLGFSFEGIKQTLSPFFRNHVNYSAMLVCLLAILWYMRKLTPSNKKYYVWLNIGLLMGLIALFFAYSRGAWVALFAGVITSFIIQRRWMLQLFIIGVTSVVLLISWLLVDKNYVRFAPNYEQTIFMMIWVSI